MTTLADQSLKELFETYAFSTGVHEFLLDRCGTGKHFIAPEFGETLGMLIRVQQAATELMLHITRLRDTHPALYKEWVSSVDLSRLKLAEWKDRES